ncbi:MAG: protein translocase subunit SecD [Bdellovibrionaceae bacterium]|nr:protein translocase subunit SecD [Pseudobdellovibrionaceae bacterium]MBX3033876.1 protein translocase subunit SecD [Pseudobdellovibrionaceae bacterium]
MNSYRVRLTLALIGLAMAIIWVLPNVVNLDNVKWWPSKSKLNYGLDIQGGLHLVMGADVDGVLTESTNRMVVSLRAEFDKDQIPVRDIKVVDATRGEISIVTDAAAKARVESLLKDRYGTTLQIMESSGDTVNARYFDAYIADYKEKVIQQAIETIRNRIDEFGVAEPSISQQGTNRILVQLPGMADAERAKQLINTTARLDFMIVSHEMDPAQLQKLIDEAQKAGGYSMETMKYSDYVTRLNKDLAGKLPAKHVVYFEKSPNAQKMEDGAIPLLLKSDSGLGGGDLDGAFVTYGQYGEPEVALRFNPAGGNKFAEITGANVGRQMAIVLDKIVKSAPNLKERISGGSAVITLGGRDRQQMMDEAKMISTSLRAGALPATLEQLEERRVGPSLGADALDKAKLGSYVGIALILIFTIAYYRAMGVVATVCMGVNLLTIFALLTTLGATLTLPGIAGIALSVGVAVDANVLINERIRDELRAGGSFKLAIQEGYNRAMSAILDSNITTGATALVLLYFGTGPVRGFAVTLLAGIVATMFANVFVSKVIVDTLVTRFGVKKLSV